MPLATRLERVPIRRLLAAATVTAASAAAILLFARNPEAGGFPSCLFLTTTGWECPGCGSLRATHQLLRGHLLASLAVNPFVPLLSPILVAFLVSELRLAAGRPPYHRLPVPATLTRMVPVALGLFWVLRNLR